MSGYYRVILAEDEPRILQFMEKKIKELDPRFEIAATARNGMDALALAEEIRPQVLFSDVKMPVMDGLTLLSRMKETCPETKCIIVSGYRDFDYVREALRMDAVDYLLKPITDHELARILKSLAREFDDASQEEEAYTIASAVSNKLDTEQASHFSPGIQFRMLLLCIGPLMNNASQISHSRIYMNIWKKIDLQSLLEQNQIVWKRKWVCYGWSVNQKYIVWDSQKKVPAETALSGFLKTTGEYTNGYPVNLCILPGEVTIHQLHQGALMLQETLNRTLVIGKSNLIKEEECGISHTFSQLLPPIQLQLLKNLIASNRREDIRRWINELLSTWEEQQYPQKVIENGLRQLLRAFISTQSEPDELKLYLAEYSILGSLSVCRSFPDIYTDIREGAEQLLDQENSLKDYSARTADDMETYIRQHYTEDISLESMADMIGFNPIYLNRIFKREKNSTPIQFLINLRMERAKELIRQHTDWDFSLISESIGYHDTHYFSRAFKKAEGISPSEYRSLFLKQ